MLTKIKKIFVLVMFATFLVVLSGCGGSEGGLKGALNDLYIDAEVTEGFALPSVTLDGATTVWKSDNESVILIDGDYAEVIRPSLADVKVTLTVEAILGEETATKNFIVTVKCLEAPNAISINTESFKAVEGQEKTYYIELGKKYQLTIDVEDESMSTEVTWTCGRNVTISEDGVLEAVKLGKAVIQATSIAGGQISDTITVQVVESLIPGQVLLKYKNMILESVPEFIYKHHNFLIPENDQVKVTYVDGLGKELYEGEYKFVEGEDRKEAITCTLEYQGNKEKFDFVIYVVNDPDENEFLAINEVKEKINEIFDQYSQANGEKISENIEFPASYEVEIGERTYKVSLKCDTECEYGVSPVQFTEVANADGTTTIKAVYTKPNDDTKLLASFDITVEGGNAELEKKALYALGYSAEEIVEYIKNNVLPQANEAGEYEILCQHITLPTDDTTKKFTKLKINWASSDESVLTAAGKFANLNLAEETAVVMTATIEYAGTNSSIYQFTKDVAINYNVKPAEYTAQKISLEYSDYIISSGLMDKIKYFPFGKLDRLDENGEISNVLPLPKTIGEIAPEMSDYANLEVKWVAAEEGLLSEEYKLLKQYLRYHEAVLTYEIEYEGKKATNEIVINVGLAELKNTIYIGGAAYQISSCPDETIKGDVLCSLSKFDAPIYTTSETYRTWGTQGAKFQGTTFYIDVYEKDSNGDLTDEFTRYQYYVSANTYLALDEQVTYDMSDSDNPIKVNKELNPYFGANFGGNWGVVYHNVSDQTVKIPFTPLNGQSFNGSETKWADHPMSLSKWIGRDNAVGIDGYRPGFVTDGEGKVIVGDGQSNLQVKYDVALDENGNYKVDGNGYVTGDGQLTEDDYWIYVPAGGYAYSTRTQQNTIYSLLEAFCTKGNVITFVEFQPYQNSPDANNDAYVHPQYE